MKTVEKIAYAYKHVAQIRHINNLHKNRHNKVVHALANTPLASPINKCQQISEQKT